MKTLLTFILIITSLYASSQIQNEKGKLILETNDTILGSITYYDDLSSTVTYIDNKDSLNSCTIECINEIVLNNGIRYTTINYDDKKDGRVFVQRIISSDLISLYASEENGLIYYYVGKDGISYRLENNKVFEERDDKRFSRYDNKYLGSLKIIMSDKPELFDQIDELNLTESDLIEIVLEYNEGNISFLMTTEKAASKTISNWVVFGQYSNFGTYYLAEPTFGYSYGIFGGSQIYFTKNKRHSFRFSLGYSHYELHAKHDSGLSYLTKDVYAEVFNIGITYEYIFFMTQRTNIYVLLHIADLSYVSKYEHDEANTNISNSFVPMLRVSPGIGLEYKTKKRLSFYAELNSVLNADHIPSNFSIGLKYDLGKITRNYIKGN